MFTVITEAEAEREWHQAVAYYEERQPGVGLRLNDRIRAVLQTLAREPERFPLATRLTRKTKILGRWPYSLYFTVNAEQQEVTVLAICASTRGTN